MGGIQNLPWWVKWLSGFAGGLMAAFVGAVIPISGQKILFWVGVGLMLISVCGALWHLWSHRHDQESSPDGAPGFRGPRRMWGEAAHVEMVAHLAKGEAQEEQAVRVPILDLVKAASEDGWVFVGNRIVLHEFGLALRQPATDGTIQIWGRKRKGTEDVKWVSRQRILEQITPDFFRGDRWLFLAATLYPDPENWRTYASDILQKETDNFIDLHVMKPEAWNWLYTEGRKARDKALKLEAEERARIAAQSREDEGEDMA